MISDKMVEALNEQINKELYSSYLYLAMSAFWTHQGLTGTAKWLRVQAGEEKTHADKIYDYLNEQGAKITLKAIAEPPKEYGNILETFEKVLAHEKEVTKSIHNLVSLAKKENDPATEIFLQWFVTEQIEEEANVTDIITKLKLGGTSGAVLIMLDVHLGKRGKE